MNSLKPLCYCMCSGVRDSVRGFVSIWTIDKIPHNSQLSSRHDDIAGDFASNSPKKTVVTTLKVRRFEKERLEGRGSSSSLNKLKFDDPSDSVSSNTPKGLKIIFKCCILNVACIMLLQVILISADAIFNRLLNTSSRETDLLNTSPTWLGKFGIFYSAALPFMRYLFEALWILPVFLITRLVNALWFADIAGLAAKRRRQMGYEPPVQLQQLSMSGQNADSSAKSFSHTIADFMVAILLESIFLLQIQIVAFCVPIPAIKFIIVCLHWCLLNSLYSFEYSWMQLGVELERRLSLIESHWPYFVGFGALLSFVTLYPSSSIISSCLFAMMFPIILVSSYAATPFKYATDVSREPDWPAIKLFAPSVWLTNLLMRTFVGRSGRQ